MTTSRPKFNQVCSVYHATAPDALRLAALSVEGGQWGASVGRNRLELTTKLTPGSIKIDLHGGTRAVIEAYGAGIALVDAARRAGELAALEVQP